MPPARLTSQERPKTYHDKYSADYDGWNDKKGDKQPKSAGALSFSNENRATLLYAATTTVPSSGETNGVRP
jgi:hypothetical protein